MSKSKENVDDKYEKRILVCKEKLKVDTEARLNTNSIIFRAGEEKRVRQ